MGAISLCKILIFIKSADADFSLWNARNTRQQLHLKYILLAMIRMSFTLRNIIFEHLTKLVLKLDYQIKYSRTSLSRTRLFRDYRLSRSENQVPVLTWNYDNRQQHNVEKRSNFSSFPHYFIYIYISNFRSQITHSFVKCDCSIYCFPHSLNSDMLRYGHLEVFQWVPWNSR